LEALADWVGLLDRGDLVLSEPMDVLQDRFKRVEVQLTNGALMEMSSLPPTWLSPRRAGHRLSFVTCEFGTQGWEAELRAALPEAGAVDVEPASLRDVFVSIASERMSHRTPDTTERKSS
jgi:hypothetical protein